MWVRSKRKRKERIVGTNRDLVVLRKSSSNKFVSIGHNEMGFEVFDLLLLSTEFATMAVLVSQDLVQLHGLFCESNELVLVYEFSGPMKASTEESSIE